MSLNSTQLTESLQQYILDVSSREPEILTRLRAETSRLPEANLQISALQGQFMQLLVRLTGARNAIELGVFTGYSSLAVAMAMPPEGRVIACDVSEKFTTIARRYWREAGQQDRIDLRLVPALQTLDSLLAEGRAGTFDWVFIDADKENYEAYYERSLELLQPGGLILIDNVLWSGRVTQMDATDPETLAIRALNQKLHRDERINLSLLPLFDGLTLAHKR